MTNRLLEIPDGPTIDLEKIICVSEKYMSEEKSYFIVVLSENVERSILEIKMKREAFVKIWSDYLAGKGE